MYIVYVICAQEIPIVTYCYTFVPIFIYIIYYVVGGYSRRVLYSIYILKTLYIYMMQINKRIEESTTIRVFEHNGRYTYNMTFDSKFEREYKWEMNVPTPQTNY